MPMKWLARSALLPLCAGLLGAAQSGRPAAEGSAERPAGAIRKPVLESSTPLPGHPVSEGVPVLDAPQPLGAALVIGSQPLAVDAVIASETMRLVALHFRIAAPISIGPPFNALHPASTDFRRLIRDGTTRYCVVHRGVYQPTEDEHGAVYPGLCLEDRDQDGRYETAVLEPYDPEHAPVRTIAIAPVSLEPNPSGAVDDPQAQRVKRRLRVTFVDAGEARIAAEQGIATSREADVTNYYGQPPDVATLPLRDGASGAVGGIEFRLVRDGAGWRITAAGQLRPWLEVRNNGSLVVAGGMEFRRLPQPEH